MVTLYHMQPYGRLPKLFVCVYVLCEHLVMITASTMHIAIHETNSLAEFPLMVKFTLTKNARYTVL